MKTVVDSTPRFWDPPEVSAVASPVPAAARPHPFAVDSIETITARAIAEGRHSPIDVWRTVCGVCKQWVRGIYYIVPGERKEVCEACCRRLGLAGFQPTPSPQSGARNGQS